MVKAFGLTHLALAVGDVERAFRFYRHVFGVEDYFREPNRIHVKTPGCHDVITFDQSMAGAGMQGGIAHVGFRLRHPDDIDEAVRLAVEAGGTLLSRGEFSPGFPFAYVTDPDGYEIEIWFE